MDRLQEAHRPRRSLELALLALIVAWLIAAAVPQPSAADTVVANARRPTLVTAFGGRVVWSGYDRKQRVYRLKELLHGRVVTLPVPPRRAPFDVDLGPDARGRTVAVYSRCRHEPFVGLAGVGTVADYSDGRGCDLYEYRLGARAERRLMIGGEAKASDYYPTIWGRTIAFTRIWERHKGRIGFYPYLYYAPARGGKAHRTPGGTRGRYMNITIAQGDPPDYEGGPGPVGLDLRGQSLGFAWDAWVERCSAGGEQLRDGTRSEMWLGQLGTQPKRVATGCDTDVTQFLFSPAFDVSRLWYLESRDSEDSPEQLDAYDPASGIIEPHPFSPAALSIARDAGTTYYSAFHTASSRSVHIVRADEASSGP